MLAAIPTFDELFQLRTYLESCEAAAVPPPAPDEASDASESRGLLSLFAPSRPRVGLAARTLLGSPPAAEKLSDLLSASALQLPDDGKRLGARRDDRIAQLEEWLASFAAFSWLKEQPSVQSALKSFHTIRKRRKTEKNFTDDLAVFRFWQLAVFAATFMDSRFRPAPDVDQRTQAIAAAKRLRAIASTTTLLNEAGIGFPADTKFMEGLAALEALSSIEKRERVDAHTNDRKFVRMLSAEAHRLFGDIPPALIYELSALKVKSPDKTAITKQVSDYKNDHQGVRSGPNQAGD